MTGRRTLTGRQRIDVLHAHGGRCYLCGEIINLARIKRGEAEPFEVEHAHALGLGGSDDPSNWFPAHKSCHADKTRRDRRAMAKVSRAQRAREAAEAAPQPGAKLKSGRALPCGRAHGLKRKVDGTLIDRATGEIIREGWRK